VAALLGSKGSHSTEPPAPLGSGGGRSARQNVRPGGAGADVLHSGAATVSTMDRRFHVSFICSGNICRSPIAEKVFAHEVEQAGLADRVQVTSAGTGSWHVGDPADSRAAALLAEHGYVDAHVARQVDDELLDADLLVALDAGHLRALRRIAPDPERVRLLRSFDPDAPAGAGVPDPYYGGPEGFTEVLTMVRAAMPGLLEYVKARL
jgi:protein-tyrosine phosphatase